MVDTGAVVAVVVGLLLALVGGLGTLTLLIGTLAGLLEWGMTGWLLLLAFVGGTGIATYGVVTLADDVLGAVSDRDLSGLTEEIDTYRLRKLLD